METLAQLFKNGGVVMYPLLGLSILSLAMILERTLFWLRVSSQQPKVVQKILKLYQDDPLALNLENWHDFEQKHPNLFFGMYKFYCAKKGQHKPGRIPEWLRV